MEREVRRNNWIVYALQKKPIEPTESLIEAFTEILEGRGKA